ncbi:MAG: hypothetical protein KZQ62_19745 [Candidatus Thiodiazotropha sp. (ex Lucinoma aequizonata)]|nr:hypothetical protein [Candidatus Thiodiazotropha sp. (ex Lucinoma aequizonata)]
MRVIVQTLVNNLLLLNQIPDLDADRSVGRDNLVIAWSPAKSAWIFLGFGVLTYMVIIIGVLVGKLTLDCIALAFDSRVYHPDFQRC